MDPNADLTPGYNTITVVTKDGRTITGAQRGYSDFAAQLVDLNGAYYSFEKAEVKSIDRKFQSLMPSYKHLSEQELDDLVAYLSGLGAAKANAPGSR